MLSNYIFKKIELSDLNKATTLIWNVFLEFEANEYSEEGIKEFKSFIEYDSLKEMMETENIFLDGCYQDNKLIGVIGYNLKPHINLLFVDKKYHGQGIAKTLFNRMLDVCKSENEGFVISVNSSPYAHEIYHKLGFSDTDKIQVLNGISFYPMEYKYRR